MLAIVAAAAALRLRGIGFGLPYPYAAVDEHLVTDHAIAIAGGDLNPRYFAYPSLVFELHALAYRAAWLVERLFGAGRDFEAFRAAFWLAPARLIAVGRGLTLLCALATLLAVARVASEAACAAGLRAARRVAAWVGAAAIGASLLHASNSRWSTVDVPALLFAAIALAHALRHARRGGRGSARMGAIAVGLAASCKYYGALLALPLALAVAQRAALDARGAPGASGGVALALRRLVAAGAATIAAFVATSPFVLLDFATFTRDFATLQEHMAGGHYGFDATRDPIAAWLAAFLRPEIGAGLLVPAALGALALLAARRGVRGGRLALALLLLHAAAHLALLVRFRAQPLDYLLVLLPGLAALAGVAAAALARTMARLVPRAIAATLAALALGLPVSLGAPRAWDEGTWLLRPDSRAALRQWIESNLAPGTTIASDSWIDLPLTQRCLEQMREAKLTGEPVPQRLPRDEPLESLDAKLAARRAAPDAPAFDFAFLSPELVALQDELFALLAEHGVRWLVLDEQLARRAQRTGGKFAALAEWYRRTLSGPGVVARFDPADGELSGPPLVVIDASKRR